MSRTWIKTPAASHGIDAPGGVVVDGTVVDELLGTGATPSAPVDHVIDASDKVLLPGLINCHHHFYQTLTRALPAALNKPLFPWLQTLYPVWSGLDEDGLRVATRLALTELMLSGCTTASDHHYLFPDALDRAIDIQVEVAGELGMRVVLTRGSMSLSVEEGGLPPASVTQTEAVILDDSDRVVTRYHDPSPGSMVQIALAPCSPFSVTPQLMRDTAILAREHGVRLHTHLGETADENDFCEAQFGMRPVPYLESVGWLADDVWLAHGIHFTDAEIKALGAAGTGVCHCPSSNMLLASGICRVTELQAAGVPVGLGVDGSASNDASNLISEVRQALLIGRLRYPAHDVTHGHVLDLATRGGAAVLGRPELGHLAPGAAADLALFELSELRFSGAGDPLAALVLCGAQHACDLMVAGQWRVRDGVPTGVDIERLRFEHGFAARRLQHD